MLLILSKKTVAKGHQFKENHDLYLHLYGSFYPIGLASTTHRHTYTHKHVERGLLLHHLSLSGLLWSERRQSNILDKHREELRGKGIFLENGK